MQSLVTGETVHSNPHKKTVMLHIKNRKKLTAQQKVNTTPVTIKTKTKSQSVLVEANMILRHTTFEWYNCVSLMKVNNKNPKASETVLCILYLSIDSTE